MTFAELEDLQSHSENQFIPGTIESFNGFLKENNVYIKSGNETIKIESIVIIPKSKDNSQKSLEHFDDLYT